MHPELNRIVGVSLKLLFSLTRTMEYVKSVASWDKTVKEHKANIFVTYASLRNSVGHKNPTRRLKWAPGGR
jgi:hypothetical protein